MIKYWTALACIYLLTSCSKKTNGQVIPGTARAHILGYCMRQDTWAAAVSQLDLSRLTDLNLAFFNPTADGSFSACNMADLQQVITSAHAANVRVYLAIGGGDPPPTMADWMAADKRHTLIANIVSLAHAVNADGVDADLENTLIVADTARYAAFIAALQTALHAQQKLLSSAQVYWSSTRQYISDATLQRFDYINIMSYDSTGFWDPSRPGPHASYSMAVRDLNFYLDRGIPGSKLLLGVPFYGYAFGPGFPPTGATASFNYKDLVRTYPGAENSDSIVVKDKGTIYYNGVPTIQAKVAYAKSRNAAGIMIWELHQDLPASDPGSLLTTIYNSLY
ncbi:hypothetical protein DCC81_19150 [Chitinophaga parva]|uniref:chitinase n=1 Tax=Chitinophaga parva TaxID=2169414 RepID=A0A2T7BJ70_9BACT|nr:glycosyl hydrolase family 18 protein [Chitinophaga parva]PUZ26339.1 hypothetical protein DCC81_19150 [Chitinophaga parva]